MRTDAPKGSTIPAQIVDVLKMSKRQFVEHGQTVAGQSVGGQTIVQTGAASIGELSLPVDIDRPLDEGLIETFVVDPSGECEPTGDASDLNAFWLPPVRSMAQQVSSALTAVGVLTDGPAFVTASLTPGNQVNGEAHFDDDQYSPGDGVGVVAICSSGAGPRVATDPIPVGPVRTGLPLDVGQELIDRLTSGQARHQQTGGHNIVLFPQFGQLHSGPGPVPGEEHRLRNLLVYRARTIPLA